MKKNFVGIDIGGSWIKGVSLPEDVFRSAASIGAEVAALPVQKVRSRLGMDSSCREFIAALDELLSQLVAENETVCGIGVSTAGIVDYAGRNLIIAAPHLEALRSSGWQRHLESRFGAPVVMINDADAAAIGAAACGYLTGLRTIGIMPVGTGVGFTLWRNGRRWAPGKILPLIGSVTTPVGSFDALGGVSRIAQDAGGDLCAFFTDSEFVDRRNEYVSRLAEIIYSACVIYRTDTILIGGGLSEAVNSCVYPLAEEIAGLVCDDLASLGLATGIKIMPEGNRLPLIGAVSLAVGEYMARSRSGRKEYSGITSEIPLDADSALHEMEAEEIVGILWKAEQDAGSAFAQSLPDIAQISKKIAEKLVAGGRLIYVGAGTSGRLASIDAVELGCTFGFPREKAITLIAGGVSDAAIEIETDFEEDASCVPEILLASVGPQDVVIGISVSGSAYYVRSALALSRELGAYTVFIQENDEHGLPFSDVNIALRSGREVIAGSTRMKAGTATKKALNFLSTTAMIMMGKVYGPYMVEMECINEKLICRAQEILNRIFGMDATEASEILSAHGYDLRQAIDAAGTGNISPNKKLK